MTVRSMFLAAVLVLSGTAAYAQSEGNNLAAVEVPAGTGVYHTSYTGAVVPVAVAAAPRGNVAEVAEVATPRAPGAMLRR